MFQGKIWRYVYCWTCRLTRQKVYTGKHRTGIIEDGYMGSGTKLKEKYEQYGEEEFHNRYEFEICQFYFDDYNLNEGEKFWIQQNKTYYTYGGWNYSLGGDGGFDYINKNNLHPKYTDKKLWSKIQKKAWAKKGLAVQKKQYEETGAKNFYFYYHTKEGRKEFSKAGTLASMKKYPKGVWFGKTHKDSTKAKIGAQSKVHQKGSGNSQFGTIWVTNGKKNMKIRNDHTIPTGFYRGRVISTLSSVG